MQSTLVQALRAQRPRILRRWTVLLRAEGATTPLAHPDTLVHLIDWTFDEVLRGLATGSRQRPAARKFRAHPRPDCACGRNPLLHFFIAGEQALLEALVLAQSADPRLQPVERDRALTELHLRIRALARAEVSTLCSLCQHRPGRSAGHTTQTLAQSRL